MCHNHNINNSNRTHIVTIIVQMKTLYTSNNKYSNYDDFIIDDIIDGFGSIIPGESRIVQLYPPQELQPPSLAKAQREK